MKTRYYLLALFIGSSFTALAQTDSVLTFKEAVRIALRNNATLNAQRNTLTQSRVNKTYRIAQLGPNAAISGSVSRSNGNQFIPQEGTVVNSTFYRAGATLQVNQPIFNGLTGLNTARDAVYAGAARQRTA
jgi:outer membrane protein TolC